MKDGTYHMFKKRKTEKSKKISNKKFIKYLDKFLMVVAITGPLMDLPQIFKIYYFKNAAGVSLLSWTLYAIFDIPWIIYGIVHKDKPIVVAYLCWMITNLFVIAGTLIYS